MEDLNHDPDENNKSTDDGQTTPVWRLVDLFLVEGQVDGVGVEILVPAKVVAAEFLLRHNIFFNSN
jgi:hypothetical protein